MEDILAKREEVLSRFKASRENFFSSQHMPLLTKYIFSIYKN